MWKIAKAGYAYDHRGFIVDVEITVVEKARRPDKSYWGSYRKKLGEFKSVDEARAFIRNFVAKENSQ